MKKSKNSLLVLMCILGANMNYSSAETVIIGEPLLPTPPYNPESEVFYNTQVETIQDLSSGAPNSFEAGVINDVYNIRHIGYLNANGQAPAPVDLPGVFLERFKPAYKSYYTPKASDLLQKYPDSPLTHFLKEYPRNFEYIGTYQTRLPEMAAGTKANFHISNSLNEVDINNDGIKDLVVISQSASVIGSKTIDRCTLSAKKYVINKLFAGIPIPKKLTVEQEAQIVFASPSGTFDPYQNTYKFRQARRQFRDATENYPIKYHLRKKQEMAQRSPRYMGRSQPRPNNVYNILGSGNIPAWDTMEPELVNKLNENLDDYISQFGNDKCRTKKTDNVQRLGFFSTYLGRTKDQDKSKFWLSPLQLKFSFGKLPEGYRSRGNSLRILKIYRAGDQLIYFLNQRFGEKQLIGFSPLLNQTVEQADQEYGTVALKIDNIKYQNFAYKNPYMAPDLKGKQGIMRNLEVKADGKLYITRSVGVRRGEYQPTAFSYTCTYSFDQNKLGYNLLNCTKDTPTQP